MARRGWSELSDAYRNRLQRGGVTRSAYEAGVPLRSARGHATTPERPGQGLLRPEFRSYYTERRQEDIPSKSLNNAVKARVKEVFKDRHKFRTPHGLDGSTDSEPPTRQQIIDMLRMDDVEIENLAISSGKGDNEWWILWYHGR